MSHLGYIGRPILKGKRVLFTDNFDYQRMACLVMLSSPHLLTQQHLIWGEKVRDCACVGVYVLNKPLLERVHLENL